MNEKYFPVIYLKSGDMCVGRACETQEQALNALKFAVARTIETVDSTTIIKRDISKMKDPKHIFGHPRSLDILQDKKYMRSL